MGIRRDVMVEGEIGLHLWTGNPVIDYGFSVGSGVEALIDDRISMVLDTDGFFKPYSVGVQVLHSKRLESVLAMMPGNPTESEIAGLLYSRNPGIRNHPIIGYHSALYAGHVRDNEIRLNGSSGGFITWLLIQLLEEGLIDGVIHVKRTAPDSQVLFSYSLSHTVQEIYDGAKSRYYPAEFSRALQTARLSGGRYALVGIPSHIYELRLLATRMPEFADVVRFTIGLICGHQKSTKYAESIAWQHGISPGSLLAIDFRKKNPGTPASDYQIEMTGVVAGRVETLVRSQEETFVADWGHGFFKAKFSDFTDDALNETADVAVGDAWLPQYERDWRGNNIIIVRNAQIARLISRGMSSGALRLDSIDAGTVLASQSGLIRHTREELAYRLHRYDVAGSWRPKKRVGASGTLPIVRKGVQNVRQHIATESHRRYATAVKLGDWHHFERSMTPYVLQYRMLYKILALKRRGLVSAFRRALVESSEKT